MTRNSKITLALILILSFFLRVYNFKSFYIFSHDQDLASWIVKDILVNGHFRLIGQETSSQGVMIGALFYYLQVPFYYLGGMSPLGAVFLPIILGIFSTFSAYYVVQKVFNTRAGLIAAFIYSISALIVFSDREVAPTMPVMLWTMWYMYSLFLVNKNEYLKGFTLWSVLIGLIWHLNLALTILSPLVVVAFMYSKRKFDMKALAVGLIVLVLSVSPYFVFEVRHNFSQSKSIYSSITTEKDLKVEKSKGFAKLDRVMQLVNKNTISLFSKNYFVRPSAITILLVLSFLYLIKTKKINHFYGLIFAYWQLIYIIFFSLISINASEYYFNGMNFVWLIIASLMFSEIFTMRYGKGVVCVLAFFFVFSNFNFILRQNTDKKGYVEKTNLVKFINEDRKKHNYPCVAISYITNPGYNLGYRYLFYTENMHINKPISKAPVYTIVFPHGLVDKIDNSFGSLGLIYPEYEIYEEKDIIKSCEGDNANLTEPMFGYTQ